MDTSCCQSWGRHPDSPSVPLSSAVSSLHPGSTHCPDHAVEGLQYRTVVGNVLPKYNTGAKFTFLQSVIMKRQTLSRLWQLLLKPTPKFEGATCWSPPLLTKGEEKRATLNPWDTVPLKSARPFLQIFWALYGHFPLIRISPVFVRGNYPQFSAL